MSELLAKLQVGKQEREIAAEIDLAVRHAGFDGPAFDTIVAAGSNTALPHARSGDRVLTAGDLVLLDFGGVFGGYCVDITRVASLGEPGSAAVKWHEAVCRSHAAALMAVRSGVPTSDVDVAARAVIEGAGLGSAFVHGTGHGLGIEVHEAPRIGKRRSDGNSDSVCMESGMVVTIEPGVYLPGAGGIRLEDDLVVTDSGYDLLTDVSLDLVVV
jgi:Xaa-Pro aminopeptidase